MTLLYDSVMLIRRVQFSTGTGSAEMTWRAVEESGPENVMLLTAVTCGSCTGVA